jgi:hypothetical protein
MKFKIGDRVKCIEDDWGIDVGEEGIVEAVDIHDTELEYRVMFDNGVLLWFDESKLELINKVFGD